jgi:hypothetical protein
VKLYLFTVTDSSGKYHEVTAHDNYIDDGYVVFVYHDLKTIMFYKPISVVIASEVEL